MKELSNVSFFSEGRKLTIRGQFYRHYSLESLHIFYYIIMTLLTFDLFFHLEQEKNENFDCLEKFS